MQALPSRNNKDFWLLAVQMHQSIYYVFEHRMTQHDWKSNREIALSTVTAYCLNLKHVSADLRADREFIVEALLENGNVFRNVRFLPDELQQDPHLLAFSHHPLHGEKGGSSFVETSTRRDLQSLCDISGKSKISPKWKYVLFLTLTTTMTILLIGNGSAFRDFAESVWKPYCRIMVWSVHQLSEVDLVVRKILEFFLYSW